MHREVFLDKHNGRWLAVYVDFEGDKGEIVDAEYLSDEEYERRLAEARKNGTVLYERKDAGKVE
jgi:hypothetical protein